MRTRLRSKVTLLFMTFGLLLAVPAIALADNINDDIADDVASALQLTAGDASSDKTAEIRIVAPTGSGDGNAGCNIDNPLTQSVTLKFITPPGVTATALDGATATPGEMKFTTCGVLQTVKFSASSATFNGNYTVTANIVQNNTTGSYNNNVSIPINVTGGLTDGDNDGVADGDDNCPSNVNTDQADNDGDGIGNVCDPTPDGDPTPSDTDGDGVADGDDNCPNTANADQADADGDGLGDACDGDRDGDTVLNDADNCPDAANANQADADSDGLGDACDPDSTPPDIEPTITGTLGNNGWYTSDVEVSWIVTDPEGVISSTGCETTTITEDNGPDGVELTCEATSGGGTTSESVTIKRDATNPVISLGSVSGTQGTSPWYTSAVTQAFTASDGSTGSGLDDPSQASFNQSSGAQEGDNVMIASGDVSDIAGNTASRSAGPFKIDLKNPSILAKLVNAAGNVLAPASTGWFNIATGAPKAHYDCDDVDGDNDSANGGASGILSCTTDHLFGDGADQSHQGTATDRAGRTANASVTNVDVDLTKPSLGITDNNAASTGVCDTAHLPSQPTTNPSDATSDIKAGSLNTSWVPNIAPSGLGSYTYSASVLDNAGNKDEYGPKTYTVVSGSAYSGVLQPVNLGAQRSSFKLGSTIPVKFTLSCNGTPINNSVAKLYLSNVDGSGDPVNEAVSTNAPDAGNTFRLTDATTGQYQFNLSTKAGYTFPAAGGGTVTLGQGTWYLWIQLDGLPKFQAASIDVKK